VSPDEQLDRFILPYFAFIAQYGLGMSCGHRMKSCIFMGVCVRLLIRKLICMRMGDGATT
jgi:hypothetical protein